ncbi:MAG: FKBP-type peptidyl-prolyl cis-trans isomerase N-terminal domain-containing protein [Reinekea sp.]
MILSTFKKVALSAGVALAITGSALAAEELKLDTDETKASYGIGYGFAQNLMGQTQGIELSADALAQGIKDAMSEAEMKVPEADVQAAIQVLQQRQMEVAKAKATEAAAAARAEGENRLPIEWCYCRLDRRCSIDESGRQVSILYPC